MRLFIFFVLLTLALGFVFYWFFHGIPHTLHGKRAMSADSVVTEYFREDKIGDYKDYSYTLHRVHGFFSSEGSVLIAEYELAAFKAQQQVIEQTYSFLTTQILDEEDYISPPPSFTIGNWHFRTIDTEPPEGEWGDFPKSIRMIAVNEQSMRIAYLDFYNLDLDYLAEQGETDYMESFIKENFSVNFRKTP